MLVGFVKAIKADTTGRLEPFLTDEAKDLLEERILAAKWYPFAPYKACFQAVCRVNAQSSPEIMRLFGRKAGEETMTSIYRTVFSKNTVEGAMESFRVIGSTVYDSITIRSDMLADNRLRISFHDFDPDFAEWYFVGLGWMERTLELVLGKDIRSEIVERSWEGAPATVFEMSW
ncbi:MAG: hypothetical protein ACK4SX_01540 [Alcanivoracaceae bacterium]